MSLKLSKNRVNFLTKLIVDHIQKNEEIDYLDDIGNIRFKIYHLILEELKMLEGFLSPQQLTAYRQEETDRINDAMKMFAPQRPADAAN